MSISLAFFGESRKIKILREAVVMFCAKCGNLLEDNAKFCDKCGTATMANNYNTSNVATKIVDNEIQLTVKPTYKSIYFMWSTYVALAFLMIFFIILSIAIESWILFTVGLIMSIITLAIKFISLIFKKKQLQHMKYDFYKTKVEYSDSFLNKAVKEVKYKYIRECVFSRTVSDRIFGFGRIALFTNAETGFGNGIRIPFIKNSEAVYKQIKELIDE